MHHIDIVKDWLSFQRSVAEWLEERRWAYTSRGVRHDEPRERNRLACEVVRESRMVWGGVGVYTVVDLFHMAGVFLISHSRVFFRFSDRFLSGIPIYASEARVFDDLSETIRLVLSFLAYALICINEKWCVQSFNLTLPVLRIGQLTYSIARPFVRRCIRHGMLAPTQKERLDYRKFLHVYARDDARISDRMAKLVEMYKVCTLVYFMDVFFLSR